MAALYAFAPDIVSLLGYRNFAYFYMASVYGSELFDCRVISRLQRQTAKYSLGASGVICALVSFYCLSFPQATFLVGGLPLKAPVCALVWATMDFVDLGKQNGIGNGAHLGGYVCGFLIWFARALKAGKILRCTV